MEILDETENVGDRRVFGDLRNEITGQLPELHVLERELALGNAAREGRSGENGEENSFLGGGPAFELLVEVVQREAIGGFVPPIERAPEVLEAASNGVLSRQQRFGGRQLKRLPGPVRSA